MSPGTPQHAGPVGTQTTLVNIPRGTSGTQTSPPKVQNTQSHTQTMENNHPQPNTGKGGKRKTSQNNQDRSQPQQSTSNSSTNLTSAFQSRNLGTSRPHIQYSACGEYDHFRKDCQHDNFCIRCRSRSHATHMCRAPLNMGNNPICVYCSSAQHTLGSCTSQPNNNRKELSSTPQDLQSNGPNQEANTKNLGLP